VRPRLKSLKGYRVFDSGEVAELTLKFGLNIHRGLIVRGHTVILDSPEKKRADAVRMTVRILQGWVIVLCGRQVVAEYGGTKIMEGVNEHTVQEDLK